MDSGAVPELAQQFGITETKGVLVSEVLEGSPAKGAGLERGDVILEYDGSRWKAPVNFAMPWLEPPWERKSPSNICETNGSRPSISR